MSLKLQLSGDYKVIEFKGEWSHAHTMCKLGEGADLASFRNQEEQDKAMEGKSSSDAIWIGLGDLHGRNMWTWTDGTSSEWTNWGNTPESGANCAMIKSGKWYAESCDKELKFMCEGPEGILVSSVSILIMIAYSKL